MSAAAGLIATANGEPLAISGLPRLGIEDFRRLVIDAVNDGARVAALFGDTTPEGVELYAVLAQDAAGVLHIARAGLIGHAYPAITPDCPQVHLFERELREQFDITPEGHPWLKPVRFPQVAGGADAPLAGVTDFYRVEGDEIHEVAVGPVHAGIIEPGHFRFQCHGERVLHLEISLGYQHRGVEAAIVRGPRSRLLHYVATLAGDTTVGHVTACCQLMESLAGVQVPPRAQALRAVALELERLANHTGDLGALAGDVGFLPTASYCGRLRGDFLNMTAMLCGSRFGRGLVRPGGIGFDVDSDRIQTLRKQLRATNRDVENAARLLWETASVMARFEETGPVSLETCEQLGLVGPAARACGAKRDVRHDFPTGMYQFSQVPLSTWDSGDVFARAYVRWLEIQQSVRFVEEQLDSLPGGAAHCAVGSPRGGVIAASLVEGWRGEICHVVITDERGGLKRYKVVDPSFHNWMGLALALRDQQISDFPLCNKSFNLSYCGHDL